MDANIQSFLALVIVAVATIGAILKVVHKRAGICEGCDGCLSKKKNCHPKIQAKYVHKTT